MISLQANGKAVLMNEPLIERIRHLEHKLKKRDRTIGMLKA